MTTMHEDLTPEQVSILMCSGSATIRKAIEDGKLPRDHVRVNAMLATRCLWENPAMWERGRWFWATTKNWQFRPGHVRVRRDVLPDGSVRFYVAGPLGRWCDSLTVEEAKHHLKARRDARGDVVFCTDAEAKEAEQDYQRAISN